MQTYMVAPFALLSEGGLASALYRLLSFDSLIALISSHGLVESRLKLLNTILLCPPLVPLLLLPAGTPPIASASPAARIAGIGYAAGGPTVREAVAALGRQAGRLQASGTNFNDVNEDGLHVHVDAAVQLAVYINTTAALLEEVCSLSV
jgi:hypothetical protein